MKLVRPVFIAALALMLGGCAMYRLEDLRQTTPTGNAFQTALARMYMDLATQMEKGYDWFSSWHFAEKGLLLAYGRNVAPETLTDWNIPAAQLPALQQARGELLVALTSGNEASQPEIAARAQLDFDCWVRYQDANWQTDRISDCREGFKSALDQLQAPQLTAKKEKTPKKTHLRPPPEKKGKAQTEIKPIAREMALETVSYVVFFTPGKPDMAAASRNAIDDVAHSLAHESGYEVVIHSYGINAGDTADPLLGEERIEAVKKRLTAGGVKDGSISAAGFSASKTEPKRGMSEAIRRRIDIFINE
ncbi:MAG: hypothetical protein KGI29_04850 [Pseudomonadota bacterium]|nr:hypothetical protein [Pseudomonadota bacterium]MDE3038184.1 hypothetical protein [Pseudomonadota bacterium]